MNIINNLIKKYVDQKQNKEINELKEQVKFLKTKIWESNITNNLNKDRAYEILNIAQLNDNKKVYLFAYAIINDLEKQIKERDALVEFNDIM